MPNGFELRETRQPPLKDQYDEWLARVICYAFSIPPSPFVNQTNRATSETLRVQAAQEGLVPLKAWVKGVLDEIVQVCLKQPDLEFAWVGDDAVDPLQQAQTLSLLVGAGIKTREEARAELGLAPEPLVAPTTRGGGKPVAKYNPYHDERGRFTTPDGAVEPGEAEAPASAGEKPSAGVEVAEVDPRLANPGVMSDVPPTSVAPDANATSPESPPGIVGSVELVDPQGASDPASRTSDFTDETSTIWQIARRLVSAAIETLGADAAEATSVASSLAGAILVASTTSTGDPNYGVVPGRPDVPFEWNPVTGKIQFFQTGEADQTGRTRIAEGRIGKVPGVFFDSRQRIIALEVADSGGYALANLGLLDEAIATLRSPGEPPQAADDSDARGDALQVFYNPDTKEIRVAPAGANSDGTLPPGFIATWTIWSKGGNVDGKGDNFSKPSNGIVVPKGFSSANEYMQFGAKLYAGLAARGYGDIQALLRGSAVTGESFRTGEPFDEGRISDLDVALCGDSLFTLAQDAGFELRSRGTRTGVLNADDLKLLNITDLVKQLDDQLGGEVTIMIYKSADAVRDRGLSISIPK